MRCLSPEGFHKLAYVEWGHPRNPNIIVCCHGLTRNSRDFDFLAKRLSSVRARLLAIFQARVRFIHDLGVMACVAGSATA